MSEGSWVQRLKERWKVESARRVILILVVFALTGTTVVVIKFPLLNSLFPEGVPPWAWVVYYVIILPVYNILLLGYGALFGLFGFFWEFEKRFLRRLRGRKG
jgi:hypothetical protein